jgi:ribosome-binding protein aMBF1 (putative translation factor)
VEKFTPKRRVVVDDRAASGLSNVELADELEAQVLHLRVVEDA